MVTKIIKIQYNHWFVDIYKLYTALYIYQFWSWSLTYLKLSNSKTPILSDKYPYIQIWLRIRLDASFRNQYFVVYFSQIMTWIFDLWQINKQLLFLMSIYISKLSLDRIKCSELPSRNQLCVQRTDNVKHMPGYAYGQMVGHEKLIVTMFMNDQPCPCKVS